MKEHVIIDRKNGQIVYRSTNAKRALEVWDKKKTNTSLSLYEFPVQHEYAVS